MLNNEVKSEMKIPSLRMYVDENGNYNLREDLTNNSNRFLCLTGVIMKLSEHDKLEEQLNALKLRFLNQQRLFYIDAK